MLKLTFTGHRLRAASGFLLMIGLDSSVVAGELCNQAQAVVEAAKDIKDPMSTREEKNGAGSRPVVEASQARGEIVGSMHRVFDATLTITTVLGEQSEGMGQVKVAMNQPGQMAQQNAATHSAVHRPTAPSRVALRCASTPGSKPTAVSGDESSPCVSQQPLRRSQ